MTIDEIARNDTNQSYQALLADKKPPLNPTYLEIHPRTFGGSELEKTKCFLNETDNVWAPYVGFVRGEEGLLFPNPRCSFGYGMAVIFRHLNYTNWEYMKHQITPVRIGKIEQGLWQLLED